MNSYLLDTHTWLWLLNSPERVHEDVKEMLATPEATIYLSAASVCEMSIKWSLGKLRLSEPPERVVPLSLTRERLTALPIQYEHAVRLAALPFHHRDPFDRLLIAQAQVESIPIVTDDPRFAAYGVEVVRAS